MSATDVLERFGLWVLLRLLIVLTVFTTLALVRLPLLWLAGALTWGMHHTDRLMTPPPHERRPGGGFPMPDNAAQSRPPAWTGPPGQPTTPTGPGRGPVRSRPARFVSWIGWHSLELSAVTVPLALGIWVTGWLAVLAVLAAVVWAVHEIRLARQQRALTGHRSPIS